MEVTKTEFYIEFTSNDGRGQFKIRVQKDCSQLQMETDDGNQFVDLNYRELKGIRNCINEALECFEKSNM